MPFWNNQCMSSFTETYHRRHNGCWLQNELSTLNQDLQKGQSRFLIPFLVGYRGWLLVDFAILILKKRILSFRILALIRLFLMKLLCILKTFVTANSLPLPRYRLFLLVLSKDESSIKTELALLVEEHFQDVKANYRVKTFYGKIQGIMLIVAFNRNPFSLEQLTFSPKSTTQSPKHHLPVNSLQKILAAEEMTVLFLWRLSGYWGLTLNFAILQKPLLSIK